MSTTVGREASRDESADGWTIVVPVKALDRAKSRLGDVLPRPARRALVLAMARDVLDACSATPGVVRVRVVTSDPEVSALAEGLGIEVVAEPSLAMDTDADRLNAALSAALVGVVGPAGVVTADLAELRSHHLARVLAEAAEHRHSTVPDHRGVGTTMAFWTSPQGPRIPRFGTASAAKYVTEGRAVPLSDADPSGSARRDVDTAEDLSDLAGRPVGRATSAALREHCPTQSAPPTGVCATMVP